MISRYKYEQLERWTADVRRQTQYDMAQLRLARARVEQQMQPREARSAGVQRWWQSIQKLVQGGVPALERATLGVVSPRAHPEQLLPDASLHGR
ncbi:MAG: hypothetical protein H0X24_06860 [Ktedonobacterales bacterium]|nr:hypothetical protein [Ktedonobacterales bacterium]